jgi:hypothetical protein
MKAGASKIAPDAHKSASRHRARPGCANLTSSARPRAVVPDCLKVGSFLNANLGSHFDAD